MLNRSKSPPIQEISKLNLPEPTQHRLKNNIPIYEINMGTQEVIKLEIIFQAGRPFEEKEMVARATSRLLKEGTQKYTSTEIAELVDFYGGTLSTPVNLDTSNIVLYCLRKHFDKLLPILAEIILNPTFPNEELERFIKNNQQRLQVELSKSDVVAYRTITEYIFGESHPYGYNSISETYDALTREDLIQHHQKNYTADNCQIYISGKIDQDALNLLDEYLGILPIKGQKRKSELRPTSAKPKAIKIEHTEGVQSAIRIGRRAFNKKHPDYHGLLILNTILGGYFGSRLMDNIREDKGYTYNIFSALDCMHFDGYFYVGTEVGNEFVEPTLKEIYYEMERLRTELIGEEELKMVRNYLLGTILTNLDGAFNVADVIKNLYVEASSLDRFEGLIQTIKTISAEELRILAQRYLQKESFWELVVGK